MNRTVLLTSLVAGCVMVLPTIKSADAGCRIVEKRVCTGGETVGRSDIEIRRRHHIVGDDGDVTVRRRHNVDVNVREGSRTHSRTRIEGKTRIEHGGGSIHEREKSVGHGESRTKGGDTKTETRGEGRSEMGTGGGKMEGGSRGSSSGSKSDTK